MYTRTDAIDDVVAIARNYYTAMLDADEAGLRALFHDRAIIAGNFEGVLEFSDLGAFLAGISDAKTGDGSFTYHVDGTAQARWSGLCQQLPSLWLNERPSSLQSDVLCNV